MFQIQVAQLFFSLPPATGSCSREAPPSLLSTSRPGPPRTWTSSPGQDEEMCQPQAMGMGGQADLGLQQHVSAALARTMGTSRRTASCGSRRSSPAIPSKSRSGETMTEIPRRSAVAACTASRTRSGGWVATSFRASRSDHPRRSRAASTARRHPEPAHERVFHRALAGAEYA